MATFLPNQFLTEDDYDELNALGGSVDVLASIFLEQDQPGIEAQRLTTDTLRMAAAAMRAGATRLEIIADRVEKEANARSITDG